MSGSYLYPLGFEEQENLRSDFIHNVMIKQRDARQQTPLRPQEIAGAIPKNLLRFWHDPSGPPDDVATCLRSWDRLAQEGFEIYTFDDVTGALYIQRVYGARKYRAFLRCAHPAMRCDYLRLCFILAEGGFYVDADNILLGDEWRQLFRDSKLKLQPLAYDIAAGAMMAPKDIWRSDLPSANRVFYVNNDPIVAPPGHPVIRLALDRATERLLSNHGPLEIQSTTGPGNLTAALAAHAWNLTSQGQLCDFELLRNWDDIAEMRWDLEYRRDSRNWRNVFGC